MTLHDRTDEIKAQNRFTRPTQALSIGMSRESIHSIARSEIQKKKEKPTSNVFILDFIITSKFKIILRH